MKWAASALLVAATITYLEGRARACAGCSNPNLPTARAANTVLAPGEVTVALNLTGTTMHVVHSEACPDIGPICGQRDEPAQLHDQRFWIGELRPVVALGLTSTFGVEAQVPVRVVHTTIQFRRLDGTAFTPDYENVHHRNETLSGISDPWLLGRASGVIGDLRITTRAGLGLPLGATEEDPFARGRAGLSHQHIQFGTGTFYPVFALDAGLPLAHDLLRVGGYGQALVFVYENQHGYHAGNRYAGGLWGDVEVIVPKLRVGLAADLLNEQPERWGGVAQQDGNVGRTDVLVGGGLSYVFGSVVASLSVKTPVYQHFIEVSHRHDTDPGQLTYPAIVNLAVQTSFGGPAAGAPLRRH
jgi:hypothetical protein